MRLRKVRPKLDLQVMIFKGSKLDDKEKVLTPFLLSLKTKTRRTDLYITRIRFRRKYELIV